MGVSLPNPIDGRNSVYTRGLGVHRRYGRQPDRVGGEHGKGPVAFPNRWADHRRADHLRGRWETVHCNRFSRCVVSLLTSSEVVAPDAGTTVFYDIRIQ